MANTNAAGVQYLDDRNASGTMMGYTTSSLLGFFGVSTLVSRQTAATAVTTAASTVSTANAAYTTTTQADQIVAAINALITATDNLGLTG